MSIRGVDVLIAVLLMAIGTVQLVADPPDHLQLAAVLTLAMTMPLLARRWWPLSVVILVAAAVATYALAVDPTPPFVGFVALIVVSYTLTAELRLPLAAAGLAIVAACMVITSAVVPTSATDWIYPLVYLGGAATIGRLVRLRASRQNTEDVLRVRTAVTEERLHISRELHDIVAHGLGVMVVHAEAADALMDTDPAQARESLRRVQETGRESIGELGLLLGLLRSGEPDEPLPQPLLAQVPALVEQVEGAQVDMRGELSTLPMGVQLAIYRVLQEALTNVAKHSTSTDVVVRVVRDGLQVVAEVVDTGPRRHGSGGAGHGLVGMRERAHLYGGSLSAEPHEQGFRVRLEVPVP